MNSLSFDGVAETEQHAWTVFHCDMEFTFNSADHAIAYANGVESTGQMVKRVDSRTRQIRLIEVLSECAA
ncbi:MAG: hypothetical protein IAF58_10230 [Leptolyngbya sp.]|nr:hypothetical protein [Candidatus Melainabacteria bacterium]